MHAWGEPQLAAIQDQLKTVNLLPMLAEAFRGERAAVCHTFETVKLKQLRNMISVNIGFLGVPFVPRGWVYRNMVTHARLLQEVIDSFDLTNGLVSTVKIDAAQASVNATFKHFSPYAILSSVAIPNCAKAIMVCARNQTLVGEAIIACALERYRLGQNQYPDSLEELAPRFVAKLPMDVTKGQPFRYRRTEDGRFSLFCRGWNETDGIREVSKDDWSWKYSFD